MRLITEQEHGGFRLLDRTDDNLPPYAILSHTWGPACEEVTFQDLTGEGTTKKDKAGYRKIEFCAERAAEDGLQHFWIDTCCIDKTSSAELSEAINSMYSWYRGAAKCYVYLSDVSVPTPAVGDVPSHGESNGWEAAFRKSRWFTRGWTLQELIAPASVEFFSREGHYLGSKSSLEPQICEITGIAVEALRGAPLPNFGVEERFTWAQHRETGRQEDRAYSLCGLFGICMIPSYGEGRDSALRRLRRKIDKYSKSSVALFDESRTTSPSSLTSSTHAGLPSDEHFCTRWCSCRCHRVRNLGSPQILSSAIGTISIRCGAERLSCNETKCRRHSKTTTIVTYRFPRWLTDSAVRFSLASAALTTQSNLTTFRVIPDSAEIFGAVSAGDLIGMQRLFRDGRASLHDVDEHNWTLLHRAYLVGREEVCKFLLTQGADAFVEADNGSFVIERAWLHAQSNTKSVTEDVIYHDHVLSHVDIDEFVQSQQYTVIHKIVFGISKLELAQYLEASTSSIDTPDARGYSPLWWASVSGKERAVQILLSYGADPHAAGPIKQTPLHLARTAQVMHHLLDYDAQVNCRDTSGRTPLHCYSYRQMATTPSMMEEFISRGADVSARTNAGHTPLHYATAFGKTHLIPVLLKHGALIDAAKDSGDTALSLAVRHNQVAAARILLHHSADVRIRNQQDQSLLHIAACFGRVKILKLLATYDLTGLHPSARDANDCSALDYFGKRQDRSLALEDAFNRLVSSFPTAITLADKSETL